MCLLLTKSLEHNWQFVIQRLLSFWKGINVAKFEKKE